MAHHESTLEHFLLGVWKEIFWVVSCKEILNAVLWHFAWTRPCPVMRTKTHTRTYEQEWWCAAPKRVRRISTEHARHCVILCLITARAPVNKMFVTIVRHCLPLFTIVCHRPPSVNKFWRAWRNGDLFDGPLVCLGNSRTRFVEFTHITVPLTTKKSAKEGCCDVRPWCINDSYWPQKRINSECATCFTSQICHLGISNRGECHNCISTGSQAYRSKCGRMHNSITQ